MAGELKNTQLAAGVVSADVTGRALLAANVFDEATVDAKFAAGSIDGSDRLKVASVGADRLAGGIVVSTGGTIAENLLAPTVLTDNRFLLSVAMHATAYTLDQTT